MNHIVRIRVLGAIGSADWLCSRIRRRIAGLFGFFLTSWHVAGLQGGLHLFAQIAH